MTSEIYYNFQHQLQLQHASHSDVEGNDGKRNDENNTYFCEIFVTFY